MIRRVVTGLGLIASVALAGAAGAAETVAAARATGTAQVARTAGAKHAPDLTGTWKFEPKRSDSMQRPEGGPAGRGPRGGGPGGAARPARLPDLMHVTMTATLVSFEDSSGKVLREVTTLAGAAEDEQVHAPGAQVLRGEWKSDRLEIQRPGRGDMKLTETVTLEENGALLVIRTAMPAFDDRPAREFKRVYRRVGG